MLTGVGVGCAGTGVAVAAIGVAVAGARVGTGVGVGKSGESVDVGFPGSNTIVGATVASPPINTDVPPVPFGVGSAIKGEVGVATWPGSPPPPEGRPSTRTAPSAIASATATSPNKSPIGALLFV